MGPELAIGLPAAGSVCVAVLRARPRAAFSAGAFLGLAGLAVIVVAAPGRPSDQLGVTLSLSSESRSLLIAAAAALALVAALAPFLVERATLLMWGLAGLAGMAVIASATSIEVIILAVLALAVLQAASAGRRTFATRLRGPVLAAALLALAAAAARSEGPSILSRLAAVGLVAGLSAALGTLPYIHEFDPDERTATSPIPWMAFLGPVMAVAVLTRARDLIPSQGGAFGAMVIGLGLLNMVWGSLASWRTENGAAAWHYSFMADWGLALCGFGLAIADGQRAALLVLYGILLSRLPLYLWSRQSLREKRPNDRPINLLAAAMLAGSAPFAGFAARILLLRAATQLYWPLALVIGLGLLLWLPPSLRLGRSLGLPRGRQAWGIGIALAINLVIGLYPQPFLSLAGL
jgi:multicomponent Na+:H+ antiporter subunit D